MIVANVEPALVPVAPAPYLELDHDWQTLNESIPVAVVEVEVSDSSAVGQEIVPDSLPHSLEKSSASKPGGVRGGKPSSQGWRYSAFTPVEFVHSRYGTSVMGLGYWSVITAWGATAAHWAVLVTWAAGFSASSLNWWRVESIPDRRPRCCY